MFVVILTALAWVASASNYYKDDMGGPIFPMPAGVNGGPLPCVRTSLLAPRASTFECSADRTSVTIQRYSDAACTVIDGEPLVKTMADVDERTREGEFNCEDEIVQYAYLTVHIGSHWCETSAGTALLTVAVGNCEQLARGESAGWFRKFSCDDEQMTLARYSDETCETVGRSRSFEQATCERIRPSFGLDSTLFVEFQGCELDYTESVEPLPILVYPDDEAECAPLVLDACYNGFVAQCEEGVLEFTVYEEKDCAGAIERTWTGEAVGLPDGLCHLESCVDRVEKYCSRDVAVIEGCLPLCKDTFLATHCDEGVGISLWQYSDRFCEEDGEMVRLQVDYALCPAMSCDEFPFLSPSQTTVVPEVLPEP